MPSYPQYAIGTFAVLYATLGDVVTAANASLAQMVTSPPTPVVALKAGHPRSVSSLTLAAFLLTDEPPQLAGNPDFIKTLRFRLLLLEPDAGDDTSETFEMVRQVVSDALTCRLDDADMLTPQIDAGGSVGKVNAMLALRTGLQDIYPYTMPDGVTVCDGFSVDWVVSFSLSR